uniref:uncharacterized protein LOC128931432 n=1 Tax=Callithrix jacchus TaxID=9483 RepID=UPI0023DD31CD|nr:uncharacterized protein LOC128931432 [Callithrix jacchus]
MVDLSGKRAPRREDSKGKNISEKCLACPRNSKETTVASLSGKGGYCFTFLICEIGIPYDRIPTTTPGGRYDISDLLQVIQLVSVRTQTEIQKPGSEKPPSAGLQCPASQHRPRGGSGSRKAEAGGGLGGSAIACSRLARGSRLWISAAGDVGGRRPRPRLAAAAAQRGSRRCEAEVLRAEPRGGRDWRVRAARVRRLPSPGPRARARAAPRAP